MRDNVEAYRLTERTAFTNGDNVSLLDGECRTAVHGNIGVTLLETTVLAC